MAQQIGGATLTGKVGSQVYGIGGTVRRLRINPNKMSVQQVSARSRLSSLSTQYRGLPVSDQSAWDEASLNYSRVNKAGIAKRISGLQLYVQVNGLATAIREKLGKTTPLNLDYPGAPQTVSDTQLVNMTEELVARFSGTIAANERLVIYASRGQSNGTNRSAGMKLIACLAAADLTPPVSPSTYYTNNLSSEWVSVFGLSGGGVTVFMEAYIININELVKRPAGMAKERIIGVS